MIGRMERERRVNRRARWLIAALSVSCACGGAVPPAAAPGEPAGPGTAPGTPAARARRPDAPAVDPIAALAPRDDEPVSWLVPGQIVLELGGAAIEAPGGDRPLETAVIERQGKTVRAVVRLPHARFSVWTGSEHLLGILQRDQRITDGPELPGQPGAEMRVDLRAGARVSRLARKDGRTRVRFVGALQVEGWVPDGVLGDAAPRRDRVPRIPSGRRTLMVMPGAVIRTEPKWTARALATVADGHFLDTVQELDPAWVEVAYADGEVSVHGYVSRRDPPGRVYRPKDPDVPPPVVAPNAKVASGTCLYARAGGEPIGYVVGDRDVELEDRGNGWWTVALDSPWGPIAFAARGPVRTDLVACAPPGSVPPPAGSAPPGSAPPAAP